MYGVLRIQVLNQAAVKPSNTRVNQSNNTPYLDYLARGRPAEVETRAQLGGTQGWAIPIPRLPSYPASCTLGLLGLPSW